MNDLQRWTRRTGAMLGLVVTAACGRPVEAGPEVLPAMEQPAAEQSADYPAVQEHAPLAPPLTVPAGPPARDAGPDEGVSPLESDAGPRMPLFEPRRSPAPTPGPRANRAPPVWVA